jgi:hypothetical protein
MESKTFCAGPLLLLIPQALESEHGCLRRGRIDWVGGTDTFDSWSPIHKCLPLLYCRRKTT